MSDYDWTKFDELPGWKNLIQPLINECVEKRVEIHQIKEKFGGLRFYVGPADDELFAHIRVAEDASLTMCEVCGRPGSLKNCRHWLRTLCEEHYGPYAMKYGEGDKSNESTA